jgi:Tol biopolymer transport system component
MARRPHAPLLVALTLIASACTSTIYRPNATPTPSTPSATAPSTSLAPAGASGDRLIVLRDDGNLASMSPDGGSVVALTSEAGPDVQITQPVASPDGRYLAWVEIRAGRASVVTATRAGAVRDQIPLRIAPFFLQWDPTSTDIAYLGSLGIGIGFGVIEAAMQDPRDIAVGGGSPLYLAWSPDGTELLVHVGTDGLGRTDMVHELRPTGDVPGTFQAPAWLPDGRTIVDRRHGGAQQLVVTDGAERRVLTTFRGGVLFEASPDGSRVAYRIDGADGSQTGVYVQGVDGGRPERVTREETTAFFWSPDGEALLLMTTQPGAASAQRWRVWNGRERFVSPPFLPSPTFAQEYVPFFDQYAQALTPWSPDGSAFAYAGIVAGQAGVWVQPVDEGAPPVLVSDGTVVVWSPSAG